MKHLDVAILMAELYFEEMAAQSALLQIGFPAQMMPSFPATSFWSTAVILLEQGAVKGEDSIGDLIAATASTFPGNRKIQALRVKWSAVSPERTSRPADFILKKPGAALTRSAFVSIRK